MNKTILPSILNGTVQAPASKSMMQRAIAAALLANGTSTLFSSTFCDDSLAAIEISRGFGAEIEVFKDKLIINGGLKLKQEKVYCNESGLSTRMFSPIAGWFDKPVIIDGKEALRKRPMDMVAGALKELGVKCTTNNGFLPFTIQGPIKPGVYTIDGSVSSQILTGMLLILPVLSHDSEIRVKDLKSKPYIAMTMQLMEKFGVFAKHENYERFTITGNQQYNPVNYRIEGDWSGASFWLAAGAITGNITIENLDLESKQADKEMLQALMYAGASVSIGYNSLTVSKSLLRGFDFDATDCPDLFPPLVALASQCKGITKILGVSRLAYKESNRAEALKTEFGKFGINIELHGDLMIVEGGKIHGTEIDSHNDHRIAMACSIAALCGDSASVINGAECVAKSYPEFFSDLNSVISL